MKKPCLKWEKRKTERQILQTTFIINYPYSLGCKLRKVMSSRMSAVYLWCMSVWMAEPLLRWRVVAISEIWHKRSVSFCICSIWDDNYLKGDAKLAVGRLCLELWREIWTTEKHIGGLYNGDGDANESCGSRWDYAERWCTVKTDLKAL